MAIGSDLVLGLESCREAAGKFYPLDPDELFNRTWLLLRESELRRPQWVVNDVEAYFIRMLKNESIAIKKENSKTVQLSNALAEDAPIEDVRVERELMLLDWLESDSDSEFTVFCKNILTLAMYSENINQACEVADIKRNAFWKYRKAAINKFYEDTNYFADSNHVFGHTLV